MILLSIIIPVYNSQDYLKRCLDSILDQKLKKTEYEIIIVNDGSQDKSIQIIKEYRVQFFNYKIINQSNTGVGIARNKGLNVAKGIYVYFMDSDDRLLPTGLRILIDQYIIPNNFPDVISFNSRTVDKFYVKKEWEIIHPHKLIFKGKVYEYIKNNDIGCSVWNNIFKKEILIKNNLLFTIHKIAEDMLFILNVFSLYDISLLVTNLNIYRYQTNEKSALTSTDNRHLQNIFFDLIDIIKKLKYFKKSTYLPLSIIDKDILTCQRWAFTRLCSANFSYKKVKILIKIALKENIFPTKNSEKIFSLIDFLIKKPLLLYVFSFFYKKIFLPYIKPYIKRN